MRWVRISIRPVPPSLLTQRPDSIEPGFRTNANEIALKLRQGCENAGLRY